jgi:hypothetical protein
MGSVLVGKRGNPTRIGQEWGDLQVWMTFCSGADGKGRWRKVQIVKGYGLLMLKERMNSNMKQMGSIFDGGEVPLYSTSTISKHY